MLIRARRSSPLRSSRAIRSPAANFAPAIRAPPAKRYTSWDGKGVMGLAESKPDQIRLTTLTTKGG